MSKSIPESDQKRVHDAVNTLREHFDSVRIFVTVHDGNESETSAYESGSGNFYAQLGQVAEWLAIQDQYQRNWAIRKDAET